MSFFYVFLGGGLGAMARYSIARLIPYPQEGFPIATFIANFVSCIVLGLVMGYVIDKGLSSKMQLLLMTGFCGGFSTFSTFSVETYTLLDNGEIGIALGYIGLSIAVCLACIFAGIKLSSFV